MADPAKGLQVWAGYFQAVPVRKAFAIPGREKLTLLPLEQPFSPGVAGLDNYD